MRSFSAVRQALQLASEVQARVLARAPNRAGHRPRGQWAVGTLDLPGPGPHGPGLGRVINQHNKERYRKKVLAVE